MANSSAAWRTYPFAQALEASATAWIDRSCLGWITITSVGYADWLWAILPWKEVETEILYCDLDYEQVMEMNVTKRLAWRKSSLTLRETPGQKLMLNSSLSPLSLSHA
jgi:hypothetical protein